MNLPPSVRLRAEGGLEKGETMMRKMLCLLLAAMLLPLLAQAEGLTLTPREKGFDYAFTAKEEWVRLSWTSDSGRGAATLHAPGGVFSGSIELPYEGRGGKYVVTVQDLDLDQLYRAVTTLPQAADYAVPSGKSHVNVSNLTLTGTATGFRYAFDAPGSDYMMLYYRTVQEQITFPVFPDENGHYEGEVVSERSYARDLYTVRVQSGKGSVRKEATVRKEYAAPPVPEGQAGRLSGVTVCIDPGHQENPKAYTVDKGPGLSGKVQQKGGQAQGKKTLRREHIVALEISVMLRDLLIRQGATVVMTRELPDQRVTTLERCDAATQADADITLRLHCNLVGNEKKTGLQIYAPLNSDYAKKVASPEEYRAMGQVLMDEMKVALGMELTDKTGMVYLNDQYAGNNWSTMACFLVEMGYMSNVREEYLLSAPDYQAMLAQGMAEGVYRIAIMRGWIEE